MDQIKIKNPKISTDESRDLKYRGFLPKSIMRLIYRYLLLSMMRCGARFVCHPSDKSFFVGFSVPLKNNPRLTESNLGQLKDILSEIQYIIKSNKY